MKDQKLFYQVLQSTPEEWNTLYAGTDKKKAYIIAKKASFDYEVIIEAFEMEYYEYEVGIGKLLPKEDRLYLDKVYKGKIERI